MRLQCRQLLSTMAKVNVISECSLFRQWAIGVMTDTWFLLSHQNLEVLPTRCDCLPGYL